MPLPEGAGPRRRASEDPFPRRAWQRDLGRGRLLTRGLSWLLHGFDQFGGRQQVFALRVTEGDTVDGSDAFLAVDVGRCRGPSRSDSGRFKQSIPERISCVRNSSISVRMTGRGSACDANSRPGFKSSEWPQKRCSTREPSSGDPPISPAIAETVSLHDLPEG